MENFEYANPATLQEALSCSGQLWTEAAVLAGGTDLISLMKDGVYARSGWSTSRRSRSCRASAASKGGVRIGAAFTIDEMLENPTIRARISGAARCRARHRQPADPQHGDGRAATSASVRAAGISAPATACSPMAGGKSLVADGENRYHAIFGIRPGVLRQCIFISVRRW